MLRVVRQADGAAIADRARTADTFWARFRGLMLTPALIPGEALWIEPCTSIHMMFMRFPIDALFLDPAGRSVALYHSLRPWFGLSGWHREARGVLELPAGTLQRHAVVVGDAFSLERMP